MITEETRNKLSEAMKGRIPWNKGKPCSYKSKISEAMKGKHLTEATRKKLSELHKGKKHSPEVKKKISIGNKNKKVSLESRIKISEAMKGKNKGKFIGEKGSNWQGGITKLNKLLRERFEYKQWRYAVFSRDNWVCQTCQRSKKLEAHHIKEFTLLLKENNIDYPEQALNCKELWDANNGVTLCKLCHDSIEHLILLKGGKTISYKRIKTL
jgi:hypothetical protein